MAAITVSALSVGLSGYMAYQGAQEKKKASKELNEYERQTLDNAFKDIPLSTIGSDAIREENRITSSDLVDSSRQAGIRGVFGGIPKIQSFTNTSNQEALSYLDGQDIKRNYAIAGDNVNTRNMRENRDIANIAALSSREQAGKEDMWNGLTGVAKAVPGMMKAIPQDSDWGDYFAKMGEEDFGDTVGYTPSKTFNF